MKEPKYTDRKYFINVAIVNEKQAMITNGNSFIHFKSFKPYKLKYIENDFPRNFLELNMSDKNIFKPITLIHQKELSDIPRNVENFDYHEILCPSCRSLQPCKIYDMSNNALINKKPTPITSEETTLSDNYNYNIRKVFASNDNRPYSHLTWNDITTASQNSDIDHNLLGNIPNRYQLYNCICATCGFSETSNKCIFTKDPKKEYTLPYKILINFVEDSISLNIIFINIKERNKILEYSNSSLKMNFNYKTGNTKIIKSYHLDNGKIEKIVYKKVQKQYNKCNRLIDVFNFILKKDIYNDIATFLACKHMDILSKLYNINSNIESLISTAPFIMSENLRGNRTDTILTSTASSLDSMAFSNFYSQGTMSFGNNNIDLNNIIKFNRYPRVEQNMTTFLILTSKGIDNKFNNKLLNMKPHEDPIKYFMDLLKIRKYKSLRKLAYKDLSVLLNYPYISSYFKDINNIIKLLKIEVPIHIENIRKYVRGEKVYKSELIELLLNNFTETQVANKISKNMQYYIDTEDMYKKIINYKGNITTNITKKHLSNNLKEIHDFFSYLCDLMESENIPLFDKISEQHLKLEFEIDNYQIRYAKDTHELKAIGRKLNICVGSYDRRAVSHSCHILVLTKNNKYKACIELDRHYKSVKQAKCYNNDLPVGEIESIIKLWIKQKHLEINTFDITPDREPITGGVGTTIGAWGTPASLSVSAYDGARLTRQLPIASTNSFMYRLTTS